MNFGEMRTEVFQRLRTTANDTVFWNTADVDRAINDGWEDLAEYTGWYEVLSRISLIAGRTYFDMRNLGRRRAGMRIDEFARSADGAISTPDRSRFASFGFALSRYGFAAFLAPLTARMGSTNRWARPIDPRTLDAQYRRWEVVQGAVQWMFMRGLWWLGVWPWSATDGPLYGGNATSYLDLYHTAIPLPLVFDSDTPPFPVEFHQALVEYALYDLFMQDREPKKALKRWSQYVDLRRRLQLYVQNRTSVDRVHRFQGEVSFVYEGPHVRFGP